MAPPNPCGDLTLSVPLQTGQESRDMPRIEAFSRALNKACGEIHEAARVAPRFSQAMNLRSFDASWLA